MISCHASFQSADSFSGLFSLIEAHVRYARVRPAHLDSSTTRVFSSRAPGRATGLAEKSCRSIW